MKIPLLCSTRAQPPCIQVTYCKESILFRHKQHPLKGFARNYAITHTKTRAPLSPTFVNLKSNTMKNTVQRYGLLRNLQTFQEEKYVL